MDRQADTSPDSLLKPSLTYILLTALVLGVYSQVLGHSFVFFDDDGYVSRNARTVAGLNWENVQWAFSTFELANWHPLTWLSYFLDVELFGQDAGVMALENALLHLVNVFLLHHLFRRLGIQPVVALILSAVWAIHPLNVESVAWISQRKTVLSTIFLFLGLLSYLRYVESPSFKRHGIVSIWLLLSLMAKPMAVTFPAMLLLLDGYPLKRVDYASLTPSQLFRSCWPLVREKLPWIAIIVASCTLTMFSQKDGGAVVSFEYFPLIYRLGSVVYAYATYLTQLAVPWKLSMLYTYRPQPWEVQCAAVILAIISLAAVLRWRRNPAFFTGWMWYLGTLVPVIGIIQVGSQSLADRYMYVPMIGLLLVAAAPLQRLLERAAVKVLVATSAVICAFAALAWQQTALWKNSETLFTNAINIIGPHPFLTNNLGVFYLNRGRPDLALPHFLRSIVGTSDYSRGYSNIALCMILNGSPAKAIPYLEATLATNPNHLNSRIIYGLALIRCDRAQEGLDVIESTLQTTTEDQRSARASGSYYRGLALDALGRSEEGIREIEAALALNPTMAEAYNDLGTIYARLGNFTMALAATRRSVVISRDFPEALYNLGNLLSKTGDKANAEICFREVTRIHPTFAPGRLGLVSLLLDQRRVPEALEALAPQLVYRRDPSRKEARLLELHAYKIAGDQAALDAKIADFNKEFPDEPMLAKLRELWQKLDQPSPPAPSN